MVGKRFVYVGIGEALSGAFDRYTKNFGPFFLFWAIPALLGFLFSIGQLSLSGTGSGMSAFGMGYGLTFGFMILNAIIQSIFIGGIIAMTQEAMRTGSTHISTGFNIISQRAGALIVTNVVVSIIIAVGLILCIIPGVIFCYWWIFALTAAALEGTDLERSMNSSKEFSAAHDSLGFIVALIVVLIIVQLIVGLMSAFGFLMMAVSLGLWPAILTVATISMILSWIITPYEYIAIAYYYIRGNGYA
jgi:hypothetical protein